MMRTVTLLALVNSVFSWNPNNYPFLPASADNTKVRNLIIEAQGPHKRILDIGCGIGYSTSEAPGCMGIDRNKHNVKKAKKLFPDKKFRHSFVNEQYPNEKYDVVTCMFYLNDLPQYLRQKTIESAIDLAEERVVVVDISPDHTPDSDLLRSHIHIPDYIKNCRTDLVGFTEQVLVDGLLTVWVYNKKNNSVVDFLNYSIMSMVD
jgi:trans-aconitate methyltransferase